MIAAFAAPGRGRWRAGLGLALIVAVAAGLRFWRLDAIPPGFHFDEAYEALEAWRVLTQPGYRPIFFPGNFGVEPMFIYLTSLAFRLFGATPTVMRGVAAVIGTATVLAVYGLGRELALNDRRFPMAAAWLAALALAVMRWHVIYSRVAIEPILVPFFQVLILWALWRAIRVNRRRDWLLLGLLSGLSLYTYQVAWLLPLSLVGVAGFLLLTGRERLAGRWRGLILAGIVTVVIAVPLGLNLVQHPDHLFLRTSQIAVEPDGLNRPAAAGAPLTNALATLAMFSISGDTDPRNNVPGMPAFDPLISLPFMIGVGLALWRWRHPALASVLIFGGVMLLPTVVSDYAPHFRRAVGATPFAALLIGLGLATILGRRRDRAPAGAYVPRQLSASSSTPAELAAGMDRLRWWGRGLVVAALVSGSALYGAVAYFDIWGRGASLFYAYDQGLWEIGEYVDALPPDAAVYLSPRPESDMTLAFAWRAGRTVRRFDGRHAFIAPTSDRPATYIIIEHEDYRGARLLRDLYPAAPTARVFHDRSGKVYARAFHVAQPAQLGRQPGVRFAPDAAAQWPDRALIGYDIDKSVFAPGQKIFLQLWWRADAPISDDWTVFTHLLGRPKADGSTIWAGLDAQPGQGSVPTRTWQPGDVILDEYQIPLPTELPAGEYRLEIGWYRPHSPDQRLQMIEPARQDHLILRTVEVR